MENEELASDYTRRSRRPLVTVTTPDPLAFRRPLAAESIANAIHPENSNRRPLPLASPVDGLPYVDEETDISPFDAERSMFLKKLREKHRNNNDKTNDKDASKAQGGARINRVIN